MAISARVLALAVPGALLGGAYISQYGFGLYPCEMCWWQRYPHFAALVLAAIGLLQPRQKLWPLLAGLAILVSGLILLARDATTHRRLSAVRPVRRARRRARG